MVLSRAQKITILTSNLGGGTGNHLLSLIRHYDSRRYDTHILSLAVPTARNPDNMHIEIISAPGRWMFFPLSVLRGFLVVRNRLRHDPPDVLHCYFFWPIIYGRLLKLFGYVDVLVENREDQGFIWGRLSYIALRLTRRLPDRIICVTDAVRDVVEKREGLSSSQLCVINNGIETCFEVRSTPQAIRVSLGIESTHTVVGMVANFNRAVKGVKYLLEAMPAIIREVPHVRFILLGRGSEEADLRSRAKALCVESNLIFAGFKLNIHDYYQIMDISVLTSLSEGLSIALLESMTHGLPIVATRVGGNPELVLDGVNGYLVPPADAGTFAQKVIQLLKSPQLRADMGRCSRELVQERFVLQRTAGSYMRLYTELTRLQS